MASASEPTRSSGRTLASTDETPLAFARWLLREKQFQQAIQTCRAALKNGEPTAEWHETLGRVPLLSKKSTSSAIDSTRARFLARDIARAANDLRQHFENTIIPLLNQMRRQVIEGRRGTEAFQDQQKNYRTACQCNSELRKTLRLLFVRLLAADELARNSEKCQFRAQNR